MWQMFIWSSFFDLLSKTPEALWDLRAWRIYTKKESIKVPHFSGRRQSFPTLIIPWLKDLTLFLHNIKYSVRRAPTVFVFLLFVCVCVFLIKLDIQLFLCSSPFQLPL